MEAKNKIGKIYTLTLNPAIDYIIKTKNKLEKITNFDPDEKIFEIGGKGLNASKILKEFNIDNVAIYCSGGFTGKLIKEKLEEENINGKQIEINDITRINLKLNFNNQNYEINSTATSLSLKNKENIFKIIDKFNPNDLLMIMGSFHQQDESFLFEISELCLKNKIGLVYDISTPIIKKLLKYNPLIIKPNDDELEKIFNKKNENDEQIIKCMYELKEMGAKNVAITMGSKGSYLLDENNILYSANIEKINLISPQGSGDSFISTFIAKYYDHNIEDAFKYANAAGAATASVKGLAKKELIEKMLEKIKVKKF